LENLGTLSLNTYHSFTSYGARVKTNYYYYDYDYDYDDDDYNYYYYYYYYYYLSIQPKRREVLYSMVSIRECRYYPLHSPSSRIT
jgi:hypothetical protein